MTADHRAQVDNLLAEYRRSRDQLASVQQTLSSLTASATSKDGSVTATVGARGQLVSLSLVDEAYRRHPPGELAALISATVAEATRQASRSACEAIAPVLPAGTD